MSPTPVKRDSLASHSRHSTPTVPAIPPTVPAMPPFKSTAAQDEDTLGLIEVPKVFNRSLRSHERCQSFFTIFNELASELVDSAQYDAVMSQIAEKLRPWCEPCALPHAQPCTLSHAQPCTLSHDPVTVTVTKEVHPASCSTEIRNLRKEISNLKSGINSLYHATNTHDATFFAPSPSPSLSELNSSVESPLSTKDSRYESSTFSTPRLESKPLLTTTTQMSYANAAKTAVTKSPKEIQKDKTAKSCTNKGTPLNVLVLSDFKSAHTVSSYKRIAEMRQKVDNILVDNKCKTISWSSRGNLVTKCAKPLSDKDKTAIINSAKATFENNPTVLNKPTFSYVKFIDVPLLDIEGTTFDTNDLNAMIQQNEKWANVNITHGPTIIVKKDSINAKKATIKVGFKDDKNSAMAKRLLKTTVLFGGNPIRCKPWTSAPPVRKRALDASVSDTEASFVT
ncbi:hypothetical protein JOM56_007672 [Amanita muscaria]